MASSRIFIKGLPPNISEAEFKKHFSTKYSITDAKLIPHRRIGYVGYKSEEEATKAVKYFNRSFIHMSRIEVELARPILVSSLPASRKLRRKSGNDTHKIEKATKGASLGFSRKRKRSDVDKPDPKLEEFMEVMLLKSNFKTRINQKLPEQNFDALPRKMQAIELAQVESDEEYEILQKKSRSKCASRNQASSSAAIPVDSTGIDSSKMTVMSRVATSQLEDREAHGLDNGAQTSAGLNMTDDEWLRTRTNRVLDFVNPGDLNRLEAFEILSESPSAALEGQFPARDLNVKTGLERGGENKSEIEENQGQADPNIEAIQANGRLFVRNLPYSASEDDLRNFFESYGTIEECHLPLDVSGASKGFVLVQFQDATNAVNAYRNIDGEPFQGRLLHILPAAAPPKNRLDDFVISKLPLRKQNQIKRKAEAATTIFNWNSLYMNQDAVNSSIADRLGVSKSELLDPTSTDAGVKQAIAETSIIRETKAYFANNGVDLNAFKKPERGDTAILVKNFPYGMSIVELRKIFGGFGQVPRVLMPPCGTIAIVEFAQAPQARAAFAGLAYCRIRDSVLFLEKAPKGLFTQFSTNSVMGPLSTSGSASTVPKPSATDLLERDSEQTANDTSTLFVRNLNFNTTSERLTEAFKPLDGFISARVNTKTDPKRPGLVLSMGFGFLEFRSRIQAQAALLAMNGYMLDDHKLLIKASHKGLDAAEQWRNDKSRRQAGNRTKIIIKNLPFEASKKDVRKLFGSYGQLRSVRVPQKIDHSARGFAFADFVTAREAENALDSLKDTHLLGRRLVLEFAADDAVNAEEEIEKMQRKVGKQVNKVALQKLTGGGRKKFNVDDVEIDN